MNKPELNHMAKKKLTRALKAPKSRTASRRCAGSTGSALYVIVRLTGAVSGHIAREAAPTKIHRTRKGAMGEATRLAQRHIGEPFGVFRCEAIAEATIPCASFRKPTANELLGPNAPL